MINYLKDTRKRFQNLKKNKFTFQMDNARPHTAAATKQILDRRGVPLVSQSPYSPDLNLLDRFLFRHIKMDLRGKDFSGPEDLSKAIQRSIQYISENTLVKELKITQITSRRCNCVSRGLYFSNPLKVVFILYITVFYLCTCNHYRMPYYMTMKQSILFQIFQSIAPNGGLNLRIFPFPLVKSSPLNFENSTASLDIHGWANFS